MLKRCSLILILVLNSLNIWSYKEKFGVGVALYSKNNPAFASRFASILQDQISLYKDHYASKQEIAYQVALQEEIQRVGYRSEIYTTDVDLSNKELSEYRVSKDESDLDRKKLDLLKDLKLEIEYPVVDEIWTIESNIRLDKAFHDDHPYIYPDTPFWVYGTITELKANTVHYELSSYNLYTKKTSFVSSGVINPREVNIIVQNIIDIIKTDLIGKAWATLQINNLPSRAQILLNGKPIELLNDLNQLEPKEYFLEVKVNGFKPFKDLFTLNSLEEKIIDLKLEPISMVYYQIKTTPEGADIFVDGQFLGRSPLTIKASHGQLLNINKEKFKNVFYDLKKETFLNFRLEELGYNPKKSKERKTLEGTMAAFALSLILPVVFFSLANNQDGQARQFDRAGDTQSADKANKAQKNLNIAGIASAAMSAALLGASISSVYYYVKSVDPDQKAYSADTKADKKYRKELKKVNKAKKKKEKEESKRRQKELNRQLKEAEGKAENN